MGEGLQRAVLEGGGPGAHGTAQHSALAPILLSASCSVLSPSINDHKPSRSVSL